MNFNEYDVVTTRKRLSDKVSKGCCGTILLVYDNDDYEIEFVDENNEFVEVLTVRGSDLLLVSCPRVR